MTKQKYPIVLLHGWKLKAERYGGLKKKLAEKGYRVFVPDMPGNGTEPLSGKPWELNNYVSFIKEYLSQNNIQECIIIGHSFGGRVAIKFVSKYPQIVKKLILTGVPGFRVENQFKIVSFKFIAKIGKVIFKIPGLNNFNEIAKKILYHLSGTWDYAKTDGVIRETFKNIINENLVGSMKKINGTTYLIWGREDTIVPLRVARKMAETIKTSNLIVVKNEGHDLPYRNPEVFIRELAL